eukprot:CAMPEP_0202442720 /NCGR_PEP_ID=MMETSP1360-20130828/2098_1 /ASSEMBLY_ACC=CAM_ASM_000848 /TAXON_ID=515479 /ORGANISM="Licmophora paradoxa, Strain CCMP2313" /LENGTH=131 /DNA_ID=CAMNT_0049058159 /DNA_START=217 /DNA_END=612 /DNA_ORIENTATION=-
MIVYRGPQLKFTKLAGVERCVVGYSGGQKLHPTYHRIKDHTEALLIEFDPKQISYEDILLEWSRMHNPIRRWIPRQYRSAIWYLDEEQQESAEEVLAGMKAASGARSKIRSDIQPATKFYRAEEYHQNYFQ